MNIIKTYNIYDLDKTTNINININNENDINFDTAYYYWCSESELQKIISVKPHFFSVFSDF